MEPSGPVAKLGLKLQESPLPSSPPLGEKELIGQSKGLVHTTVTIYTATVEMLHVQQEGSSEEDDDKKTISEAEVSGQEDVKAFNNGKSASSDELSPALYPYCPAQPCEESPTRTEPVVPPHHSLPRHPDHCSLMDPIPDKNLEPYLQRQRPLSPRPGL
jgi:hypothetical protein